jgi:hypothetical protein
LPPANFRGPSGTEPDADREFNGGEFGEKGGFPGA